MTVYVYLLMQKIAIKIGRTVVVFVILLGEGKGIRYEKEYSSRI